MDKKIQAKICLNCNGSGLVNGNPCENCKGTGFIGTDGTNEYYLSNDGKGNMVVTDIKTQSSNKPLDNSNAVIAQQKKSILRSLLLIILIILYLSFLGTYYILIKDIKVFWVATIIFVGLIFIYLMYDTNILNKLINITTKSIFKEPEDFIKFVKEKTKNQVPI